MQYFYGMKKLNTENLSGIMFINDYEMMIINKQEYDSDRCINQVLGKKNQINVIVQSY